MIPIKLHCFGPLQIVVNGRLQTKFATDRARLLLVYLTTAESRAYRRDELAALLWPERLDKVARQNLRTTLSRLRRATAEYDDNLLIADYKTVRLNRDLIQSDVAQFSSLLAASEGHRHQQQRACSACVEKLEQAIALYRGDFLQGFHVNNCAPLEDWLLLTRELWRQEALQTLASLTTYYEQEQQYEQTITYARQLLTLEPWHEQAQQQLMRGLTFSGKRTEALAQYEQYVANLAAELAIQPEQETVLLYEAIRRDELVAPDVEEEKTAVFHHFPIKTASFVGRTAEIEQIKTQITDDSCRLLTVLGVGGIGKTRLIVQATLSLSPSLFPDGVYFISLTPLLSAAEILPLIAERVGYVFNGATPAKTQLFSFLHQKRLLLVLDNFEHLLNGAGLIADLLTAAANVKCLITSRIALQVAAEWRLQLSGLPYTKTESEAAILFTMRGRQYNMPRRLSIVDKTDVGEICRMVQGMPLALEMAAAWLRVFDLKGIVAEINHNLDFLVSAMQDMPSRHRSMRAVFDGSWQQLPAHEQRVFARLSHFRGSFTQAAALAVADASFLDLALMLDHSLVQRLEEGRYAIHELLRQFAAEKLEEIEGETAVSHQHATYYLALAVEQGDRLRGKQSALALKRLQLDMENIWQAWKWATTQENDTELRQSGIAIADYFLLNGLYEEGSRFFISDTAPFSLAVDWKLKRARFLIELERYEEAEAIVTPLTTHHDPTLAATAHLLLTHIDHAHHQLDTMDLHITNAEILARKNELPLIQTKCMIRRGVFFLEIGESVKAEAVLNQALAFYDHHNDLWGKTKALRWLAKVVYTLCRDARPYFLEILRLQKQIGSRVIQRETLRFLGQGAMFRGEYADAQTWLQESAEICEQIGNYQGLATVQYSLARLRHRLGDFEQAAQLYEQLLIVYNTPDNIHDKVYTLIYFGLLAVHKENFTKALSSCQQAAQLLEQKPHPLLSASVNWCRGHAYAGLAKWAMAQSCYETALAVQKKLQPDQAMDTQAVLAEVLLMQGQADEAFLLIEDVLTYLERTEIHRSEETFRLELACVRVLAAHGDERELPLLQKTYQQIKAQAAALPKSERRDWFLERIPANAGIMGMANGRFNAKKPDFS